jgi:uncharacterized membrane protein YesL
MRQWLSTVFTRPSAWLRMSLVFLLCALPLVSAGWAWGITLQLAYDETENRKIKCLKKIRENFSFFGLRFFFLGLVDIVLILALILSFSAILDDSRSFLFRIASAFFIWIDTLILFSSIYRYPMLVVNPGMPLRNILANGILLIMFHPGHTFLFFMVILSVLLITFFSGLFFPFLAPGAIALLSTFAYRNLMRRIRIN